MPIKPENKALYPKHWSQLSHDAKERAGWKCTEPGCTCSQYAVGYWQGEAWIELDPGRPKAGELWTYDFARVRAAEQQWRLTGDEPDPDPKVIVIVLTTAHLDHDPTNCAPENLAPKCQRHHLRYDQAHHTANAYMTRMKKRENLELDL